MRIAAWTFFALAVGFPAWVLWSTHQEYMTAHEAGRYVCGLPMLAAFMLSVIALSVGGGLASMFACVDYRRQPKPRVLSKKLETWLLTLPFIAGIGLITYNFLWFWMHSGR